MRTFIALLSDKQQELMHECLVREHVSYLEKQWQHGRVKFCGPCTDGSAVMLIEANDIRSAKNVIENDPFSDIAYYQTVTLKEIQPATPANQFLLKDALDYLSEKHSNALS